MPSPRRRLRALQSHLCAGAAAERQDWEWAPGAEPRLLDDAAMQSFVVDGFLVLPLKEDFPPSFHRKLHADALDIFERSGRVGGAAGNDGLNDSNDIFPVIPELGELMRSPTITGALQSVLGPGFEMNGHRHMHNSSMGSDQTFHKDSQRNKPSGHLPHGLFVFYYPGGVTESMGPTELVGKSQYLAVDDQDWGCVNESPSSLAPSVVASRITTERAHEPVAVISHLTMIHRATRRLAEEDEGAPFRPMMKFIFNADPEASARLEGQPAWDHDPAAVRSFAELTDEPVRRKMEFAASAIVCRRGRARTDPDEAADSFTVEQNW